MYSQKFSYDRFGNRYLKASENSAANDPLFPFFIEDNNVDRSTNRLASNTNTSYDESGDVVTDNKFRGLKYFYDANGRMVKSSTLSDVEVGIAVMDAAGNKVAERVNDVWRFAVYDAFGRLVADYGGATTTDEGGVKFVQQDIRGSTRCVTSLTANVKANVVDALPVYDAASRSAVSSSTRPYGNITKCSRTTELVHSTMLSPESFTSSCMLSASLSQNQAQMRV